MKRKIKFRVWNGKSFFQSAVLSGGYVENGCWDFDKSKGVEYQQFTGLEDINGKEIYEGDIVVVRCYDDWDDAIGFDVIYEVKWCDRHVGWRGFTKKMLDKNYSGVGLSTPIKVIGNIFENPDL